MAATSTKKTITPTATRGRKSKRPTAAAAPARVIAAWIGGTGFGGSAQEKLNTEAMEQSKMNQKVVDKLLADRITQLNQILKNLPEMDFCIEAILRGTPSKDSASVLSALLALFNNNGADSVERREFYLALLEFTLTLASSPASVPIFLSNLEFVLESASAATILDLTDSGAAAVASPSITTPVGGSSSKKRKPATPEKPIVLKLTASEIPNEDLSEINFTSTLLGELTELSKSFTLLRKEDPNAGPLADLILKVRESVFLSAGNHPHFAKLVDKIRNSVMASRPHQRKVREDALKMATLDNAPQQEIERAYKSSLAALQYREISFLDLCKNGSAAHSYVKFDATTNTLKVGEDAIRATRYVLPPHLAAHIYDHFPPGHPYASLAAAQPSATAAQLSATVAASSHVSMAGAAASVAPSAPGRMRRINNELTLLRSSCPLEWGSSVFCAVDENRPDIIQCLIIGPQGTPYQNGCFLFDCCFPVTFPQSPPNVLIQTTGGGQVRFNPNLYKDGKVCLSLLGTWNGPGWEPKTSSLWQVLVSIQSLIMVEQPYFNEPGYEATMNTVPGKRASQMYNAQVRYNTMRVAMVEQMDRPPYAFAQVIKTHFQLKAREIREQLTAWAKEHKELMATAPASARSSAGYDERGGAGPVLEKAMYDQVVITLQKIDGLPKEMTIVAPVKKLVNLTEDDDNYVGGSSSRVIASSSSSSSNDEVQVVSSSSFAPHHNEEVVEITSSSDEEDDDYEDSVADFGHGEFLNSVAMDAADSADSDIEDDDVFDDLIA